jgi:hypothetical protein
MPRIESGVSTTNQANVSANFALSTQLVPTPGGQYSAGFETASLAFTSGVSVLDFRNGGANLMLVTGIQANIAQMAVATVSATGLRWALQLFIRRAYTAQSTTNATALTLSTNNCKLRTSYATSGAQIGVASAAGGISAGTVTDDATPLITKSGSAQDLVAATNANQQTRDEAGMIWVPSPFGGPIVLAANEGFKIFYLVTTAAAAIVSGQVQWSELGTTVYP